MKTHRTLMILTSHRLDCLKLCLELMEKHDVFAEFDRCVFLLNGVTGAHLDYVRRFIQAHPETEWDSVAGPRGRSECISSLENQCIERYPGGVYVKVDEDIFVSAGWARRLLDAYDTHKESTDLGLITPIIPNNAFGLYMILTEFYPELLEEYRSTFGFEPSQDIESEAWRYASVAEWGTRKFIRLEEANNEHRRRLSEKGIQQYHRFSNRFSVGCVCFDYRHWEKMGGIPAKDEPEWCAWIEENGQHNVLDGSQIVLHYSFFVQQDWLDRKSLLEDIRVENLPETLRKGSLFGYRLPRCRRIAAQLPRVAARRMGIGE